MTPRTIVFATNNPHKLQELRAILGPGFDVRGLRDIGCHDDIPETGETLRDNALIKARYVKDHYGYDCIADDTGLMVDALGGEPGVRSARYAGDGHDSVANMNLLLSNLQGVTDRNARFMTVICLIEGDEVRYFEGVVEGEITTAPSGDGGFGYDPVFRPLGSAVTFAVMDAAAKNQISHRGRACARLMEYIHEYNLT